MSNQIYNKSLVDNGLTGLFLLEKFQEKQDGTGAPLYFYMIGAHAVCTNADGTDKVETVKTNGFTYIKEENI